jgi:hypothetical protein
MVSKKRQLCPLTLCDQVIRSVPEISAAGLKHRMALAFASSIEIAGAWREWRYSRARSVSTTAPPVDTRLRARAGIWVSRIRTVHRALHRAGVTGLRTER